MEASDKDDNESSIEDNAGIAKTDSTKPALQEGEKINSVRSSHDEPKQNKTVCSKHDTHTQPKKRFKLSRELDTTDLVKLVITTIGSIFVFLLVTVVQSRQAETNFRLSLAKESIDLIPIMKNYYTNELSSDGRTLEVKVVLESASKRPIYVHPPFLWIVDKDDVSFNLSEYVDLSTEALEKERIQFSGIVASGARYQVTYSFKLKKGVNLSDTSIRLKYEVQIAKAVQDLFEFAYEPLENKGKKIKKLIHENSSTFYGYTEEIYLNGTNKIWDNFFNDPR